MCSNSTFPHSVVLPEVYAVFFKNFDIDEFVIAFRYHYEADCFCSRLNSLCGFDKFFVLCVNDLDNYYGLICNIINDKEFERINI